jgi:Ca2+-transporting ATPase
MRSIEAASEVVGATPGEGLSDEQVARSLAACGPNRLTPLPREPVWKKFLAKFDEPIIKILLAASLLKLVVDLFDTSATAGVFSLLAVIVVFAVAKFAKLGEWLPAALFGLAFGLVGVSVALAHPSYEGLAVIVAVILATGVAFLSEFRSDREFEKLNAAKDAIRVKVQRNGQVSSIPLEDVVVGDLVILGTGDEIPADGRVLHASELLLDQSLMTGESEPVPKAPTHIKDTTLGPEQPACVFRGTQVVDGVGQMVVTNVGDDTMIGQIARNLSHQHEDKTGTGTRVQQKLTMSKASTPLQEKLAVLAGRISTVGYVAAIAIFVALFARGLLVGDLRIPSAGEEANKVWLANVRFVLGYFVYMVIVIVVAVPEGLPMSVTVSLAIAWRKMSKANSLVRQLVACETIGSATVICSDKTGTLTQNKMSVSRVGVGSRLLATDGSEPRTACEWLILNAAVNSTTNLELKNGKITIIGNTTEGALLNWLAAGAWVSSATIDYREVRTQNAALHHFPFSSERKRMTTVASIRDNAVSLVKGAPEAILALCTHYTESNGETRELTPAIRDTITAQIATAATDAMRTLAFAHREVPNTLPHTDEGFHTHRDVCETQLTFDGWVGIRDPLRDDVKQAIAECRAAGIEVKMITGDNIETASAIAREVGLLDSPDAIAMTHAEFDAMSDEELTAKLPRLRVLARALPGDKYRLVRLLQSQNHVVAMTGDGTNDAPALKRADVGLAMGISGTEVAKEASKIVLLDDAFSTIVRGVQWGRALYENIQRFIQFQLTINVSALLIAFLGPFLGLKPPFTVLQLLWINVIMDTFAAIALCSEPPRRNLMERPPKRRDENILTPAMLGNIFGTAAFFVVVMIGLLIGMQHAGWFAGSGAKSDEFPQLTLRQVTLFFSVYVFFQVWNQINCRSLNPAESGLSRLFANPQFLMIASLTVIGQLLIVSFGGRIFEVEPLTVSDWGLIACATASVLLFAEVSRRIRLLRIPRSQQ